MDEGIGNEQMRGESELEGLRVKGLGDGECRKPEMGTGLEGEREGVEVRREREAAHAGEEAESGERGGKGGVGSDDVVEGEGRWFLDAVEESDGISERSGCRGEGGGREEIDEGVEEGGDDQIGWSERGVGDGAGMELKELFLGFAVFDCGGDGGGIGGVHSL